MNSKEEVALQNAIEEGDKAAALYIAAADLALKDVNLPANMRQWQASRVPLQGDRRNAALHALDTRDHNFSGDRTMSRNRQDEERRLQLAASRAASEVGHYSLEDNNPNGSIAWRSPDGDLNATLINTVHPYTQRTAEAIEAVEAAGYQAGASAEPHVEVPNPFHASNAHHNLEVFQAQE